MKYLVLWSGGLDSTYLIWKLLNEGHTVHACQCAMLNNEYQLKREGIAIDKLYPLFKKFDKFEYSNQVSVNVKKRVNNNTLPQFPALLMTALYCLEEGIDFVAFGYVRNDDAISYLDDIKKSFNGFKGLMWNKEVKLVFPLLKTDKVFILNTLPKEFLDLISFCENSDSKNVCDNCNSCRRHAEALRRRDK